MAMAHMYSMLLEWNILDNGLRIDFYQESGLTLTEPISRVISRITSLRDGEDGF